MSSCYKHALEHESFSKVFINPTVCFTQNEIFGWGSSAQIRGELAVFSGLNMMLDVHIYIFKNTGIITITQILISNMYEYEYYLVCHKGKEKLLLPL